MAEPTHRLATLSFAGGSPESKKLCLWLPPNSADSRDCNAEGRERAEELVRFMRDENAPFLYGHVVAAIIQCGEYGPLETGFFHRLAQMALEGAAMMPAIAPAKTPRANLSLVISQ